MNLKKSFENYLKLIKSVRTTVHWYDLYDGHSVKLDFKFQRELFRQAIKKAGNYSELGRKLKIGRKTIAGCYKYGKRPKIRTLKKIVSYLNYPLKEVNAAIISCAGLKPILPFCLHSPEGAEIRAAFLSDGHIDKSFTGMVQYCALEKELHERLIYLCRNVFGFFETKTYFNNGSHITKFPSVIGKVLELGGVSRGDKRITNFGLPKDIFLGKKEIQAAYLRRVFDDEGDVCFDSFGKRAVRVTRSTNVNLNPRIVSEKWIPFNLQNEQHNLLRGEQLLLLGLGIDAKLYEEGVYKSKNGNITAKWRIQVAQQDQLRKFAELINFSLICKKEKLNQILNSYQYRKLSNGKGKEEALEFIKKTFKKKGFIKFGDLGKEMVKTGRSYNLAGRYLNYFLDIGVIKKVKRGIYVLN